MAPNRVLRIDPSETLVAVCGAGFSHIAGLPLQKELADQVIGEDLVHMHNTVRRRDWDAPVDLEEFLTSLYFEDSLGLRSSRTGFLSPESCVRAIAVAIYNTLVTSVHEGGDQFSEYLAQATRIWDHAQTVITLNWDTLFEIYARSEPDSWTLCPSATQTGKSILKLHGSMDWFALGSDYVESKYFAHITGKYWRFKPFSEGDYFWVPNALGDIFDPAPALIAPTHSKAIPAGLFRRVWVAAYRALRFADHVLIVGYSLPPEDPLMTQLLHMCMWPGRSNAETARITVVDPDPTGVVEARYRSLFGESMNMIQCSLQDVRWAIG